MLITEPEQPGSQPYDQGGHPVLWTMYKWLVISSNKKVQPPQVSNLDSS